MNEVKVGTITGNGAAQNIELGFIPDFFEIVNYTDGDAIWQWYAGMTAGHAIKTTTAVAKITSNGISPYAGTDGDKAKGITIGTDVSISAKVLYWRAVRNIA